METKNIRNALIGFSLALFSFLSIFAFRACGSEANRATQVTFDRTIELPGNKILEAGTYWLVAPQWGDGKIVQILDEKCVTVLASKMAISATRSRPSDGTEFVFSAPSGNHPELLLEWFYPGELSGYEFVYDDIANKNVTEGPRVTVMAAPGKVTSGD
jgi:hypothetical protein